MSINVPILSKAAHNWGMINVVTKIKCKCKSSSDVMQVFLSKTVQRYERSWRRISMCMFSPLNLEAAIWKELRFSSIRGKLTKVFPVFAQFDIFSLHVLVYMKKTGRKKKNWACSGYCLPTDSLTAAPVCFPQASYGARGWSFRWKKKQIRGTFLW